ncbi:MAG: amino acid--tRNA ligase-related protein, partial [Acidimicrobiales bacterium]
MKRTLVRDLVVGERVRVCGWAEPPALRDHTGTVGLLDAQSLEEVPPGSAIEVWGTVVDDGLLVERLHVAGPAERPLPIDATSPLDARLDWRYLDLRRPRNRLVFEIQTTMEGAMREWWAAHGYLEVHSPKLRAMPNRSGRELFSVGYFDRTAYLAQSPQFFKQMAMAAGFDRVFEIGPVFRANPLVNQRHDTEFTSVDVEVSWIDSHEDVMALEEQWLGHVLAAVEHAHGRDLHRHFGRQLRVPEVPFPRIPLAEAQRLLGFDGDIDADGERRLGEQVAARYGHELVFVTEYPAAVRPFYHMRLDNGSDLTRSFDLLWNGLEVTTGAQREHRHDRLVAQAAYNPERVEVVRTYLDFFRYGCPPHGGFGLGLTRTLMAITGVGDV